MCDEMSYDSSTSDHLSPSSPVHPALLAHSPSTSWKEIDFTELEITKVIGHGGFGVVKMGLWRGRTVAVKVIENEDHFKAFLEEARQMARVRHENIIELYGACTAGIVGLVMEFAPDGSLYDLLHGKEPRARYTAGHALSWALQCARGVEYLHTQKLVHRDLKPPNLLLSERTKRLKICDFGTVSDLKTYMTNNKGSAAWMAPEVFEGNKYSEKCDSFSWGLILWEVLTRRRPYEDLSVGALAIMWAVHTGTRPPMISTCPKPLEILMTRCWNGDPEKRPSMTEIVHIITYLLQFLPSSLDPVIFPSSTETSKTDGSRGAAMTEETLQGVQVPVLSPTPLTSPIVVEEGKFLGSRESAPASLYGSLENILFPQLEETVGNPTVAAIKDAKGHRRTGSYDQAFVGAPGSKKEGNAEIKREELKPLPIPRPFAPSEHSPGSVLGLFAAQPPPPPPDFLEKYKKCIEPNLLPLPPAPDSDESLIVFREHCQMAEEYIQMREEIVLLSGKKSELMEELAKSLADDNRQSEYGQLLTEKERLLRLRLHLQQQLDRRRKPVP